MIHRLSLHQLQPPILEAAHKNELASVLCSASEQHGSPLMIYRTAARQALTQLLGPPSINEALSLSLCTATVHSLPPSNAYILLSVNIN